MRPAVISGCSATALAIGGWALPIVFPHVDPTVAKYMLWLAAFLLLTAVALWLWGRNRGPLDGGLTQSSSGDGATNVAGPNATVNVYHGQSSPAETKVPNYSLANLDVLERAMNAASKGSEWNQVDSFHLYQAACLWIGVAPPAFVSAVPAEVAPILQRLKSDLARVTDANFLNAIKGHASPEVAGVLWAINRPAVKSISAETLVSRENLILCAELRGEKPAFLFKGLA